MVFGVSRPPGRQAATMQPWYPFTRTSRPSFDERLASLTRETYQVQEFHLPVYHALCAMLEEELFA